MVKAFIPSLNKWKSAIGINRLKMSKIEKGQFRRSVRSGEKLQGTAKTFNLTKGRKVESDKRFQSNFLLVLKCLLQSINLLPIIRSFCIIYTAREKRTMLIGGRRRRRRRSSNEIVHACSIYIQSP